MVENKNNPEIAYKNIGSPDSPELVPMDLYHGHPYFTEEDLVRDGYVNPTAHPSFEGNVKSRVDSERQAKLDAINAERERLGLNAKYGPRTLEDLDTADSALTAVRKTAAQIRADRAHGHTPTAHDRL